MYLSRSQIVLTRSSHFVKLNLNILRKENNNNINNIQWNMRDKLSERHEEFFLWCSKMSIHGILKNSHNKTFSWSTAVHTKIAYWILKSINHNARIFGNTLVCLFGALLSIHWTFLFSFTKKSLSFACCSKQQARLRVKVSVTIFVETKLALSIHSINQFFPVCVSRMYVYIYLSRYIHSEIIIKRTIHKMFYVCVYICRKTSPCDIVHEKIFINWLFRDDLNIYIFSNIL